MNLRGFLLEKESFSDADDNRIYFSPCGYEVQQRSDEFWVFLDEGLRCGGIGGEIVPTKEKLQEFLLGKQKAALREIVKAEIEDWEGNK